MAKEYHSMPTTMANKGTMKISDKNLINNKRLGIIVAFTNGSYILKIENNNIFMLIGHVSATSDFVASV